MLQIIQTGYFFLHKVQLLRPSDVAVGYGCPHFRALTPHLSLNEAISRNMQPKLISVVSNSNDNADLKHGILLNPKVLYIPRDIFRISRRFSVPRTQQSHTLNPEDYRNVNLTIKWLIM